MWKGLILMDYVKKILLSIKKDYAFDLVKIKHLLAAKFGLEEIRIIQSEMPMTLWNGEEVYSVRPYNFKGFSEAVVNTSDILKDRHIEYNDVYLN